MCPALRLNLSSDISIRVDGNSRASVPSCPKSQVASVARSDSRKPTAEEEAAAVVLDDPRLTLAAAGVTDGCSLLAYFATSSDKGACFICVVNP